MGVDISYSGKFILDKEANLITENSINKLNETRHEPSDGFPSYYCDWELQDRKILKHNGNEKSNYAYEWISWIIQNILIPNGYILNGEVIWRDDYNESGKIIVTNNNIEQKKGCIVYE